MLECKFIITTFNDYTTLAAACLLLGIALIFTIIMKGIQIRALPQFFRLIRFGVSPETSEQKTREISPFHALFTAMSTSLGIGTIVGPSIAIVTGGPGALFWMFFYAVCGAAIKFVEVTFGVYFRTQTKDGFVLGGPMQYLHEAHPFLARWYTYATVFLFTNWSMVQSNVLSETLAYVYIPPLVTGCVFASLIFIMLCGGAKRVGNFNSKLVPVMYVLYVGSCLFILLSDINRFFTIIKLIVQHAFAPAAALGGFLGASVITAMRTGIYRATFITESGMGTAAIPHSMANVEKPTDQGILAMTSVFADTFVFTLSGLIVLTNNTWQQGIVCNTLVHNVFQQHFPLFGHYLIVLCIVLFAMGTMVGNSFNGRQSFAAITQYKYLMWYYAFVSSVIFFGALIQAPLVWSISDRILPFVVIPHLFGLVYLFIKNRKVLSF